LCILCIDGAGVIKRKMLWKPQAAQGEWVKKNFKNPEAYKEIIGLNGTLGTFLASSISVDSP